MFDDMFGEEELMTVRGLDGFGDYGGMYQVPDGSVYQGLDDDPDGMRDGFVGEIREGSDGRLYQWVEGYDGLGEPIGFWSLIPAVAKAALPLVARYGPRLLRGRRRRLRRIVPLASRVLRQVAAAQPALPAVSPMPVAAVDSDETAGIGALYQAPDGSLYQVQGFAEDDQLSEDDRLSEDDLIRGLAEDERLAEDDLIRGLDEDERLEDETGAGRAARRGRPDPGAGRGRAARRGRPDPGAGRGRAARRGRPDPGAGRGRAARRGRPPVASRGRRLCPRGRCARLGRLRTTGAAANPHVCSAGARARHVAPALVASRPRFGMPATVPSGVDRDAEPTDPRCGRDARPP